MSPPDAQPPPQWKGGGANTRLGGDAGQRVPQRSPLPPTIPRRVGCRLAFFEALWWQISVDALATLEDLADSGWSEENALDALDGYRSWLLGNIDHAVDLGRLARELAA